MIKLEKEQTARFAARLEQETQESVMRDIAQFSEADIVDTWASEPPACAEVHAMVFNMERGVHIDEAIEFLKDNPSLQPFDLILANATPALQAAVEATDTIPILGTSVTEYGVALGIDSFTGTVGGNVSGTSDLAPLDQQAAMLLELFPDAKKVGILYCSAEPNSVYQSDVVKAELEKSGVTVSVYTFTDSNDVAAVTATACDENDVLYIPTDNTAASCTEAINNVAEPAGVPIIAGEEGICAGCGVATLSINYYDLGVTTGKMAAKILTGEANISEMPIEYFPDPVKKYNPAICEALGITVPEDYVAIG